MKVIYKKRTYNVQWPKHFNAIIRKAAKKHKRSDGMINWKEAEADGDLKGLPRFLTLRDISQRHSALKRFKSKKHKERKKELYEKYKKEGKIKQGLKLDKEKFTLFRNNIPADTKEKHGWKPKTLWTNKQKEILLELVKIYRKSKVTIDWETLIDDPKIKKLPYQDRFRLMKYYGQCLKRKRTKKEIKKKRNDAIRYKYENYGNYISGQRKRYQIMKKSVNDFLIAQIPLR